MCTGPQPHRVPSHKVGVSPSSSLVVRRSVSEEYILSGFFPKDELPFLIPMMN